MLPWYANADQVARALDSKETARNQAQVERAADAASRAVEGDLLRRFYPQVATYTFPAPRGRTLFLDSTIDVDLVAADTVTVAGTVVGPADRDLLPVDGPPFSRVEFADTVSFGTDRRPISIAGNPWGYDNRTEAAGTLAAAVADTTTTTVDLSDSSVAGVGDLLTVGTERMVVSARAMLATGQTLAADLTSSTAATAVQVADGTAIHVGEVLLVDSERLLVVDIVGNALTVRRAWDGSTLAGHTTGAPLSALRRLTVERATLGTTAATHALAAPVVLQVYPGPVVAYTVALAEHLLLKEFTGQGGDVGGRGVVTTLEMLADDARRAHRRLLLG